MSITCPAFTQTEIADLFKTRFSELSLKLKLSSFFALLYVLPRAENLLLISSKSWFPKGTVYETPGWPSTSVTFQLIVCRFYEQAIEHLFQSETYFMFTHLGFTALFPSLWLSCLNRLFQLHLIFHQIWERNPENELMLLLSRPQQTPPGCCETVFLLSPSELQYVSEAQFFRDTLELFKVSKLYAPIQKA